MDVLIEVQKDKLLNLFFMKMHTSIHQRNNFIEKIDHHTCKVYEGNLIHYK